MKVTHPKYGKGIVCKQGGDATWVRFLIGVKLICLRGELVWDKD